jgi:polysaccharide biosynthesis transport protein
VLRRNAFVFLLLIVTGVAVASGYAALQTPQYASTAEVYVSTGSASNASDLSQGTAFSQQIVADYAHIATNDYVLQPVIRQLGLDETVQQLGNRVTAEAAPNTSVLQITVEDASPDRAQAIANAIAARLSTAAEGLSPASQTGTALVKVTRTQGAIAASSPTSPNLLVDLLIGALAGLVLAVLIAVLREAVDTRVRDLDDLARVSDEPVLGEILTDRSVQQHPLVVLHARRGAAAEAYRSLRTNLQFLDLGTESIALVMTSSIAAEGKSVTTANLAAALADAGERVLVIDADLRRPRIARILGLDGSVGLTDVLIGRVALDDAIQPAAVAGLDVLPSGPVPPNPGELLQGRAMVQLLEVVKDRFDVVLIDAPPLTSVSDAAVLARRTAGAIIVARLRRVRRQQLVEAESTLRQVDARILGLLPTMVRPRRSDPYLQGADEPATGSRPQYTAPDVSRPPAVDPDQGIEADEELTPSKQRG